jgi:hypothetical protein
MAAKTSGFVAVAVGSVFVYAGVKGFSILKAIQSVIQGKPPATGQNVNVLGIAPGITTGAGLGAGTPKGAYDHAGLMKLWTANGGDPSQANNAACHAIQESSGNPNITSSNPDGGTNVGLWQLDTPGGVGAGHSIAQLKDPNLNARITIKATNNGRNWSAWATPGC